MESDNSSAQQDPIPLGLFGDTLTSLQGLNDQFSPLLLQRSPPCGSLYSYTPSLNKQVSYSPFRQDGVLLSDLADRSPSAGSVTVASLCNHVSPDSNLRCTNFIKVKGKRFCNKHPSLGISSLPASYFPKQTVNFISPVTVSNTSDLTSATKTFGKSVRTVKLDVRSLQSNTGSINGIDVPEKRRYALPVNGNVSNNNLSKVCFVRKVGEKITVGPQTSSLKNALPKRTTMQATTTLPTFTKIMGSTKTGFMNSQTQVKTVRLNVIKPITSSSGDGFTQIRTPEHLNARTTSMHGQPVSVSSSKESVTSASNNHVSNAPKVTQSLVVDESTLKKLVDVLNSRSDLSTQQQISLLRSLGITVLQAPPNSDTVPQLDNKQSPMSKTITGKKIVVKKQIPFSVATGNGFNDNSVPGTPSMLPVVHGQFLNNRAPHPTVLNESPRSAFVQPARVDMLNKSLFKAAVKRKQKASPVTAKKSKSTNTTHESVIDVSKNMPETAKVEKKKRRVFKAVNVKTKQPKSNFKQNLPPDAVSPSIHESSESLMKLPTVPGNAAPALQKLAMLLTEKMLFKRDLFQTKLVGTAPKSETDKNKTVNPRLLKTYVTRKRAHCRNTNKSVDYTHCLNDLQDTDIFKTFVASQNLLSAHLLQRSSKCGSVHHEVILSDLLQSHESRLDIDNVLLEDDIDEDAEHCNTLLDDNTEMSDEHISYTIRTKRLKDRYEKMRNQLEVERKELDIVMESYEEDPKSTCQLLASALCTGTKNNNIRQIERRQCQLSNNNGLCCVSPALPYATYCKQHIWHCSNQCLYKLDQNMKPTADITPEPFVKRVKKRTKLPLIKKYKKKKKKKVEEIANEHRLVLDMQSKFEKLQGDVVLPSSSVKLLKVTVPVSSVSCNNVISKSCSRITSMDFNVSDMEESKPSDTSEEDLHLTGHEIMLNGVFDKLPEDPQDFDLFTTDKGAEELERALLLAATSPSPDHEGNKLVSETCSDTLLSSNSKNAWTDVNLTDNQLINSESSSDAIVVCDAPHSNSLNEHPPSIESFDQSQCVHYTFGSNIILDSSNNDDSPSLLDDSIKDESFNAEDDLNLQDIERVLERLQKDADDVNSPKLPSSPAVDQYTSMLAKQLSQEAEHESSKHNISATKQLLNTSTAFPITKDTSLPTLTRSYSLPVSNDGRNKINNFNPSFEAPRSCNSVKMGSQTIRVNNNTVHITSGVKSQNSFTAGTSQPQLDMNSILPSVHGKQSMGNRIYSTNQTTSLPTTMLSKTIITPIKVRAESSPKSAIRNTTSNKSSGPHETPRKLAKKSARKPAQTMSNPVIVSTISSKNIQSPALLTNPVLPLTLMQSPTQNGNVIKVIVPPGTVVNGNGGQQNMLLIPVSALVKPGNQNFPIGHSSLSGTPVKTQLSSLQAGQQFFIVNNATASLQSHLALMQKRNSSTTRQVIMTSNAQKVNNLVTGQKQGNMMMGTKLTPCNIKPNVNTFMKQIKNTCIGQSKTPANRQYAGTINQAGFVNLNSMASNMFQAKYLTPESGKFTLQPQTIRRTRTPSTKVAKAKFDPVTKKYVPGTTNLSSTTKNLTSSVTTTETLSESMMKVQQIDSVLSTLNSAAKTQQNTSNNSLTNGLPEKRNKNGNWSVRSTMSLSTNATSTIRESSLTNLPLTITVPSSVGQKLQHQKNELVSQSEINSSVASLSDASVGVSSGTVHWNQTTTAGPEITPTVTVPVYITGALSAGTWSSELAVNGSLAGATVPLIFPANKLNNPNCQIPQRVLLSNIGSLAVASSRGHNSFVTVSNNLLMSATSNAQTSSVLNLNAINTNMNSTKMKRTATNVTAVVGTTMSVKMTKAASSAANINIPKSNAHIFQAVSQSVKSRLASLNAAHSAASVAKVNEYLTAITTNNALTTTNSILNPSRLNVTVPSTPAPIRSVGNDANNNVNSSVTKTLTIMKETPTAKKKNSRKASHDTILHDPLMFDPTTLDLDSGELMENY